MGAVSRSLREGLYDENAQYGGALFMGGKQIKVFKGDRYMEITQEHEDRIQEIMREMQCPRDFECYKTGFEKLSKVRIVGSGMLVECLEEKAKDCGLKFSFGFGYFCKCPLRKYVAKNLKV
jgi:hypothetical protein